MAASASKAATEQQDQDGATAPASKGQDSVKGQDGDRKVTASAEPAAKKAASQAQRKSARTRHRGFGRAGHLVRVV